MGDEREVGGLAEETEERISGGWVGCDTELVICWSYSWGEDDYLGRMERA